MRRGKTRGGGLNGRRGEMRFFPLEFVERLSEMFLAGLPIEEAGARALLRDTFENTALAESDDGLAACDRLDRYDAEILDAR